MYIRATGLGATGRKPNKRRHKAGVQTVCVARARSVQRGECNGRGRETDDALQQDPNQSPGMTTSTPPAAAKRLFERRTTSVLELPKARQLFEDFAAEGSKAIADISGVSIKLVLRGLAEVDPSELEASRQGVVSISAFVPEWNEHCICCLDRMLVFRILDSMYGGDPAARTALPSRDLTALEQALAVRLAARLLATLSNSFRGVIQLTTRSERILDAGEPSRARHNSGKLAAIDLLVAEFGDSVCLGLPMIGLEQARDFLSSEPDTQSQVTDPAWAQALRRSVSATSISVVAALDGPEMLLSDVAALKPGSMLEFVGSSLHALNLECEGQAVFVGRLGQSGGAFTVCLERPASPRRGATAT